MVPGAGCIYPVQALTIADQLAAGGLTWRAYMEDMADEFGPANCVHPGFDEADEPERGGYAATHNPFAYFHSLLDLGACGANDVPLDGLAKDLKKADTTPNYAYISPNLCNAGVLGQCPERRRRADPRTPRIRRTGPGPRPARTRSCAEWVPRILKSPAYKKDGALMITFGEAQPPADAAEPTKVGALLLSRSPRPG